MLLELTPQFLAESEQKTVVIKTITGIEMCPAIYPPPLRGVVEVCYDPVTRKSFALIGSPKRPRITMVWSLHCATWAKDVKGALSGHYSNGMMKFSKRHIAMVSYTKYAFANWALRKWGKWGRYDRFR